MIRRPQLMVQYRLGGAVANPALVQESTRNQGKTDFLAPLRPRQDLKKGYINVV